MSGKTKRTTRKTATKTGKAAAKKTKTKPKTVTASRSANKIASKNRQTKTVATKTTTTPAKTAGASVKSTAASAKSPAAVSSPRPAAQPKPSRDANAADILARAEADLATVIDSLNSRMNTAMATLTNLAAAQHGNRESVMRTAPLDRASAMFQRLVSEVIDDHWAEMLPPIAALRIEMDDRFAEQSDPESEDGEFFERARNMLDQVLATAKVIQYDARAGETFDSVIHQAVGETHRDDLDNGVVGELIQAGFRTERGKVVSPAKVKVNRR